MSLRFSPCQLLDKAEQLFEEAVHNEELLSLYARGFITENDLVESLAYLKKWASSVAHDSLERECEENREYV